MYSSSGCQRYDWFFQSCFVLRCCYFDALFLMVTVRQLPHRESGTTKEDAHEERRRRLGTLCPPYLLGLCSAGFSRPCGSGNMIQRFGKREDWRWGGDIVLSYSRFLFDIRVHLVNITRGLQRIWPPKLHPLENGV